MPDVLPEPAVEAPAGPTVADLLAEAEGYGLDRPKVLLGNRQPNGRPKTLAKGSGGHLYTQLGMAFRMHAEGVAGWGARGGPPRRARGNRAGSP